MPTSPASPCIERGCPNRAVKHGRCSIHASELQREWRERYPDTRPSRRERDYGSEWQRIRLRHLHNNPWCADCLAEGKRTRATEVHHKVTRRLGGTDTDDNLLSCCHDHHSRRTAQQEPGGWAAKARSDAKKPDG